jgi:ribosomal protein S18 acetylase RimI-like enzyme
VTSTALVGVGAVVSADVFAPQAAREQMTNATQSDLYTSEELILSDFYIRPLDPGDRDWVAQFTVEHWEAEFIVAHGEVYRPHNLPGFVAIQEGKKVGLVTYTIAGDSCEIVSLDSLRPSMGIGTALVEAVKAVARQSRCRRVWLITTNDNLNALRFYQKRGFALVKIRRNALEAVRQLKPIPLLGADGIPIRDEIELELTLEGIA